MPGCSTASCASGAPLTRLVLPTKLLALPLPGSQPGLSRLLEQQAELYLAKVPNPNLVTRIIDILSGEHRLARITSSRMARRLGISTRTLSRRLRQENTTYGELFDQVRRELALRDLAYTQRPIGVIAGRLGLQQSELSARRPALDWHFGARLSHAPAGARAALAEGD